MSFSSTTASAASGDLGGTVFDDTNVNGLNESEAGVAGITVTAFDAAGVAVGSTSSGPTGDWLISGLTDGTEYRIEFTDLPAGFEASAIGGDNGTSVTFAQPESAGIDFAIFEPTVCNVPPSNALLRTYGAAATCSALIPVGAPKDAFGLINIDNAIPATGRVAQTAPTVSMLHDDLWSITNMGNVYGIAIDNRTGDFFTAASSVYSNEFLDHPPGGGYNRVDAFTRYGDIGGGADDLSAAGTIYKMDAVTGVPTVLAALPQQSATFIHSGCEGQTPATRSRTTGVGLGNVLYDETFNQLFVSNWEDGHIYRLAMDGTILEAYDPDLSDDGTAGMANGKVPFGLEVSADSSRLYFGYQGLTEIWSIDLAAGGFTGTASTNGAGVQVFENAASEQLNQTITPTAGDPNANFGINATLLFSVSDLELLPNGNMLAGLRVSCEGTPHSSYNHTGQTHTLTPNGASIFTAGLGALDISVQGDAGADDNYGGVAHRLNADNSVDYVVTSGDILTEDGPHGIAVFPSTAGSPASPLGAIDFGTSNDPKGIIGDVEVLNIPACTNSDIEIGNRVWLDLDQNGVQDPGETPLENVTVTLLDGGGATVATTTTDANGNYLFTSAADGVLFNTAYEIDFDASTTVTALPGGFAATALVETSVDSATGANADAIDSDVVSNRIAVTTGGPGENNHTLDAGYTLPYDLALFKVYTSDTYDNPTDGVVEAGSDVVFTISVINQGAAAATNVAVTDFIPAGFALNDAAWTDNGDGSATRIVPTLNPGATEPLTITLSVVGGTAGAKLNIAEISADNGNDIDSTPDVNPANDNQPAAAGDPGDDVVDNAGGDEDDHDIAGVTLVSFDLALINQYTSDTFAGTTDGVIENGSDVTFTLTITNQGSIDSTGFVVTDYLPAGFVLNDGAWTDNGDGTASITSGALAAGASTTIPITMTAVSAGAGDLVNWAEISTDDGNDIDSTPDTDQANDAQPSAPGQPTDDVIDNSDGDEDDHDPAPITVVAYDLALSQVYTSDTFGGTTDGVVENGTDVTFTITVTNQGSVDATTFTVTDYIPTGFVLNDAAWTPGAGNTATFIGGPLTSGSSTDITITMTATGATDGSFVNWAEISTDDGNDADSTPDTDQANDNQPAVPGAPTDNVIDNTDGDEDDHDPAGVVVGSFDLALTKVYTSDTSADGNATDAQIADGDDVVFTINVINQGTIDAGSFTVTDYIPTGFVLNDAAWTAGAGNTATFTGGAIAAGGNTDITITLTATGATTGAKVNLAEISADDGNDTDSTPDGDPANDNQPAAPGAPTDNVVDNTDGDEDDHDIAGVTVSSYDLALSQVYTSDTVGNTTDGLIEAGADVTFTITVTNQGSEDATNFTVTDYMPTGFVLNDAAWTDNGDGTAFIDAGPLVSGASTDITITLTADSVSDGDFVNWAEISSDDGDDGDSTPDIDQTNDAQPTGPGQPTDNVIDNTGGDEDDHDPAGVTVRTYDLALTKVYTSDTFANTSDGIIQNGSDAVFTITVTNQGSFDAASFEVTDYIPAGFVLNDAAWTAGAGNTATIAGGPLVAGTSVDITITLTATSAARGDHVNWAEISADDGNDSDSTTDTDQTNDNQPAAPGDPTDGAIDNTDGDEDDHDPAGISVANYDLALSQVYTSDTFGGTTDGVVENGTDVTFTITVTNQGTIDAASFEITDYLPTGFVLNDAAWTAGAGNTATFTGGALAAGASTDVTITMTATGATDGSFVNWAEISTDDGFDIDSTPDATQGNDNQPANVGDPTDNVIDNTDGDEDDHDPAGVVVGSFDLALTKVYTSDTSADGNATDAQIADGDDVVFTINVINQGTIDAGSFTVTDYIPTGFVLSDAAWTAGAGNTATFTGGAIAAGGNTDITITLTATGATPGAKINVAEISTDDGNDVDSTTDSDQANDNQPAAVGDPTDDVVDNSPDAGGNADEDDHDIAGVSVNNYDLALSQVYTSDTFGAVNDGIVENGADVTFTITVTNQGTTDATNFTVTDYLPTGFDLNDAAWTDNGDGTAFIDAGPLAAGASTDITITLTATGAADGDFVNWAEISTDDGDDVDSTPDADQANDSQPAAVGDPTDNVIDNTSGDEDDHDPAGVSVLSYDLALTKVFTSDTFADPTDGVIQNGSDAVFTITVTNQGSIDATTFTVTDYIPTGFVLNDAAWSDDGGGLASIVGGPLLSGASVDISITLTSTSAPRGTSLNWAEISADDGNDVDSSTDTDQANDSQPAAVGDPTDGVIDNTDGDEDDHDPAAITVANYDLALSQVYTSDTFGTTTDGVIENGSDVTFTITVTNQGTIDASIFRITDYLPTGFVLNDAAWTDNGDGTATFIGGALVAGASTDVTITMTATGVADGSFVNWAEISSDDGFDVDSTPDSNQANDNQPANVGDPTDNVIDNTPDAGGNADEDDHDPAAVVVGSFDLALTKVYTSDTSVDGNATDGQIADGDDVVFTINVINQGSIDAGSFTVTDYIPTGFVLSDAAWTAGAGNTATFTGGAIAAGGNTDITITLTAAGVGAGNSVNLAEISTDDGNDIDSTPDGDQANDNQPSTPGAPTDDVVDNTAGDEDDHDIAGITVTEYDLALTVVYTSDTFGNTTDGVIENGADVTFTVEVTNQGTLPSGDVVVTAYLPAGFVLNDAAWTAGAGNTATIPLSGLANGAATQLPITLTADSASDGDLVLWAEISSDDGADGDSIPDADQANDSQPVNVGDATDNVIDNSGGDEDDHDPAGVTVRSYDLALTKVYTSDTFANTSDGIIQNGSDAVFTITVTNQGSFDAASFEVTDYIPAGFVLNDAAWTAGAGNTASITGGPLVSGASTDITITVTATGAARGDHVNWAEISADDGNDGDSTTDTDQANDAQPANVGDPTDGVIDNTDGDEDDHDPAGISVANYDLALSQVYTSDTFGGTTDGVVENGTDVTFTITVTNQGTIDATSFQVVDYLPTGFVLNDAAWTDNGDGTATFTGGALAAGASIDITVTMTATGASDGSFVNWAEISTDDGFDIDSTPDVDQSNDNQPANVGDPTDNVIDNTDGDEDDHDPAEVTVGSFDLALTKVYTSDTSADGNATDAQIADGDDVVFTINVINQGSIDAGSFTVTDYIPAGFVLNDAAWTAGAGNTATFTGGALAVGANTDITITLTATGATPGAKVNVAEISSDDGNDVDSTTDSDQVNDNQPAAVGDPTDDVVDNSPDAGGNADEDDHDIAGVSVNNYDLALSQVYTSDSYGNSTDGIVENGADVTFTITVTNQGTTDATNFTVTDYLPTGFDLNDAAWTDNGDGTAFIDAGPLAAGASTDITITMTANGVADGDFVNWAEISTDDGDDVDSTPDADQANDAQPVNVGDPTDGVIDNSGGDEDDHDPAGVSVLSYDLALTKVYTSDTFANTTDGIIQNGSDAVFTITVTNQGTIDATTFTVTDYIPTGFALNDAAWTAGAGDTATIAAGPLASGASTDIRITLTATSAARGDHVNWAEISADDGTDIDSTTDTDQANDSQPANVGDPTDGVIDNTDGDEDDHDPAGISVANYDLALSQVYTSDDFDNTTDAELTEGDSATFTITVTNQGTIDANSFQVVDYLPAGFTLNDAGWTDNADGTATFTGGALAAGASVDIPITLVATTAPDGTYVNWAEIVTDDGFDIDSTPDADQTNDNQPANVGDPTDNVIDNSPDAGGNADEDDHDPAEVTVGSVDFALTKVYTSDNFGDTTDGIIAAGSDVTFTITVTNQGTVTSSANVIDYVPAGFTGSLASGTVTDLAPGASVDLTITLTAGAALTDGTFVNRAEIDSMVGTDVDSTPDNDPDNDNQPADPGDPTDDVTDNTDGDEDDHDIAGVTVASYDLALTQVYTSDDFGNSTDGIIQNGSNVTFTITVENQGTIDAGTFDLVNYIPTGFSLNDGDWTDNGDGTATFTGGPLAAGATATVDITLTADTAPNGPIVNWAEISADDGVDVDSTPDTTQANDNQPAAVGDPTDDVSDNTAGDEDDHDPAGVSVVTYDLALTKQFTSDTFGNTADGVVENGSDATFTITVVNQGTQDASTVQVTDYLPAGFDLNDANWTAGPSNTASTTVGPIAAGASVTVDITVTASTATDGAQVNWAEISGDDGDDVDSTTDTDPSNDDQPTAPGTPGDDVVDNTDGDEDDHDPAGLVVASYDLALSQVYTSDTYGNATDGVVENGADVTFTITVENQGTVDANSFTVVDYIPTGLVLNDAAWTDNGDGTATFTGGALAAGATTDVSVTFTVDSAPLGDIVNWAEISGDDGNDVDSTPDTDVSNDAQPLAVGDPTDDVTDNSPDVGGNADEDDHDPAGVSVAIYDLALTKDYTSDTFGNTTDGEIQPSADVTYTITVTNQGSVDAATFSVTDYFPAGFTLNDAAWTDNGNNTATITAGPLAAGASVDIGLTLTAGTVTPGSYTNWAEISADDGIDIDSTTDVDQTNDNQPSSAGDPTDGVVDGTAGDEDDHDPAAVGVSNFDLALSKVYTSDDFGDTTDGVIQDGSNITFTINVVNQGTIDAITFDVVDYLPTGLVLNDAGWTDNGDGTATFTGGPLDAGDATAITITATATGMADGDFVNYAEISSDDGFDIDSTPDSDVGNDNQPALPGDPTDDTTNNDLGDEDDHDLAGFSVASFDLALQKSFTSDTFGDPTDAVVEPGADATFTITLTNQGSLDAASFEVTDYIPAGFVLNDPAWTSAAGGNATITGGPLTAGASVDLSITLTATSTATPGDFVNWAEISNDSGDDVDSTTDSDPANDDQPTAPGAPGDDVVDNTGGDEDDHDPAGISVEVYDLALTKVYTSDTSADGNATDGLLQIGDDVTFTVTVTNQGTIDAATFTVTDAAPAGFVLNDAAWTDNGDGTASRIGGPLTAGASVDMPVTFTVNASGAGDLINRAEISADDGNDVDSVTDVDPSNDPQPVNPGDPTDDVTDNTPDSGGTPDEDDHDIAGITVDAYDLALTKVYISDTSADGNATDGAIVAGDDVVFTIEVFNQGTADAANIEVTDYIPTGFVLNDTLPANAGWTAGAGNTATIVIPSIPAGTSVTAPITLNASGAVLGSATNLAEISADDGTDVDSTPNVDPGDDGPPVDDVTDNSGGDEDDHDPATITVGADFDLALVKSLDSVATSLPVVPGQDVTFVVTVINQGSTPASGISLIDYVDTTKWLGFDAALNPAGTTTGDAALGYSWNAAGTDGSVAITGELAGGQSIRIPVTLTIAPGANLTTLTNTAEIATALPTNPDGSTMPGVVDDDSTPDTSDGDPLVDDVTDNSGGDEDDHDIATVAAPLFSLGNQVWMDANNNGVVDGTEAGIAGVIIDLFADDDNDGNPDDRNGDGSITAADALVITSTDANGLYLFTDLAAGNYVAGISPSQWERGQTLFGMLSSDVTVTDGDSPVDNDDNGTPCQCADGYVFSGSVTLGDGEPTGENPDNDSVTADPNENLTVDFGFWQPNFDLALRKQLVGASTVKKGDNVTFTLTVFNQGNVDATDVDVIDYIPSGLRLADADWTQGGAGATTRLVDTIPAGGQASVNITLQVTGGSNGPVLNTAEIVSATAVSSAGAPYVLPNNQPLPDVDSVPDAANIEAPVDDEINNADGDEDDHDVAQVTISNQPVLALTGLNSGTLVTIGFFTLMLGAGFMFFAKRRDEDEAVAE